MNNADILKTEEDTLELLRKWSMENKEIRAHIEAQKKIEKQMFDMLFGLAGSMNKVLDQSEMIFLKETIEKHNFLQLISDSKKALELAVSRDFIEDVEQRVKAFEQEVTRLARFYDVTEYENIEDLDNITEKLRSCRNRKGCLGESFSPGSMLTVLMYSCRILSKRLSSLAVWLSYKNP